MEHANARLDWYFEGPGINAFDLCISVMKLGLSDLGKLTTAKSARGYRLIFLQSSGRYSLGAGSGPFSRINKSKVDGTYAVENRAPLSIGKIVSS